ncbi:MAG: tripartite tricarboxylate transporter substrate-binding protein [Rhodospirillaceae bacterium]
MKDYASRLALGLTTALVAGSISTNSLADQEKVPAYKGKQVTITVGFDAGGTYGLYAQLFAKYLKESVPGNPAVVVQYMPGAGGMKASNYAFNVMPKNGFNLFEPPDTVVITNLLEPKKARYDARQFKWLGTAVQTNAVLVLRSDTNVKTLEDLRKTRVNVGSTGSGSQTFLIPAMLNGMFGTKMKIIQGYAGSQKAMLAMEKKELDGISLTWGSWKATRGEWFKNGFATRILQVGINKDPDLADVPILLSLVKDGEMKKIVGFMSSLGAVGRSLVFPPKTPKMNVELMRASFQKVIFSDVFKTDANKRRLDVNPLSGEELEKIVGQMMDIDKPLVERARQIIMVKGRKGV